MIGGRDQVVGRSDVKHSWAEICLVFNVKNLHCGPACTTGCQRLKSDRSVVTDLSVRALQARSDHVARRCKVEFQTEVRF